MRFLRSLPALLLGAALGSGCGGDKVAEGDGTGVVRALSADGKTITLAHGEIPGVMKGMTMEFAVARPELLAGVAVGETVAFHVVHENGAYTVTELHETAQ